MASESRAHSARLGRCVTERGGFARAGAEAADAGHGRPDDIASGTNPAASRVEDAGGDTATAEAGAAGSESTETTKEHVVQSGNPEEVLFATGPMALLAAARTCPATAGDTVAESY